MKVSTVVKIIIALLFFIFIAMFIIENMDPVPVYFPVFKGRRFGLIFIMFGSYIMGALTSILFMARVGSKMKKKKRLSESLNEEGELFDEE